MKNLVLRLFLSCLIIIITTMSYAGNYLPILTWPGTGTYKSDGLDPEVGIEGTIFTFRVKYIDYDDEAPAGEVMVCINTADGEIAIPMLLEGTNKDYRKGVIYKYATSTLTPYSYSYYFKVTDAQQQDMNINITEHSGADGATMVDGLLEVTQFPETKKPGPSVASEQILDWLGSGNYATDGLYPDSGGTNTVFTYKVKCFGILSPGYPILSIVDSTGNESTCTMTGAEGISINGKVYYATHTFSVADSKRTYSFKITETENIVGEGPEIYPNGAGVSAFLDWTGEPGYEDDGVEPDIASYGSTFTYRIKYVDVEEKPPIAGYPEISWEIRQDTHQMDLVSGTSASGAIYQYQGTHPSPDGTVAGTIKVVLFGDTIPPLPIDINTYVVNIPPILTWTGETGYTDDGVKPNIGTASTRFTFRIKYMDPEDGDIANNIALVVDKGTASFSLPMTSTTTKGIYEYKGTFSLGEHSYYFYAIDSQSMLAAGSESVVDASDITVISPQLSTFTVSIGTLDTVTITGTDSIGIEESATFTAQAFNELGIEIGDSDVAYTWSIVDGTGTIISGTYSKTVTIKAGTNTGTLTLGVTANKDPNSTLQGDGVTGTKTIIIKPGKPQALFFSDTNTNTTTANLPVGSSTGFVVLGRDSYGNVATVENCNWQTEGMIGTLGTSTSNTVIFTAGTAAGTSTVVVSTMGAAGTLTATISITITSGTFHHFDISMGSMLVAIDGSMSITLIPKDINNNTFPGSVSGTPSLRVTVGTNNTSLGTCAINTPVEFSWPQGLRNNLGVGHVYALINGNKVVGTSTPFNVIAGSPHHFEITSPATNTAVQAGASLTIEAKLKDVYNNPVTLGTSACVIFQSDSFGTFTVNDISSTSPGTITIQTGANGQIAGAYQPNPLSGSKAILANVFLASDNSVSGTSNAIILTIPTAPDTISVITQATFTAGIPCTISVIAKDRYNNPATATITFSGSLGTITPAGCAINGGIGNGFSWQDSGTWTGTVSFTLAQLQAVLNITTQNGKTAATTFTVLPTQPHSLQPTTATNYNGSSGDTWTFGMRLSDEYGNRIGGQKIVCELISNPSNATLSATTVDTDQLGMASNTLTIGTKTGTYSVKVYPEGFPDLSATFTATTIVGSPTLATDSYPSIATVSSKVILKAIIKDDSGNPFPNKIIQWQILQSPSGIVVSPSTSTTNNQGIATTSLTLGTKTGVYTVKAQFGTLIATFTITATPDTPLLSQNFATDSRTVKNEVIIEVALRDRFGNPCLSAVEWGLIDPLPATASLSATSTTINPQGSSGIILTLGTKTGVYIVKAQVGTLTAIFAITAEPGAVVTMLTGYLPTTAQVNTPLSLTVGLYDSYGNPVTAAVDWQSHELATTTQTINGTATLVFTLGTRTGGYEITASHEGRTATFTITATPDTPLLSQNFTAGSQTVCSGIPLEVSLRDKFGNPCLGTVSWSLLDSLPATASISATSTIIAPQTGSASITLTIGTKTGVYIVKAQSGTLTATFTITAESGAVETMLYGYSPATAKVGTTLPLTIGLYDSYGNPVTAAVDWQSQGLATTTTQTINGTATLVFTLGTRTGKHEITASHEEKKATFTITATHGTPTISQNLANISGIVSEDVNLEITLRDEFYNAAPGTATWSLIQMPATAFLNATITTINPQTGTSSVTLHLGTKTGDYMVRAQIDGHAATFTINVKSGNPATSTSSGTFTGTAVAGGTMTFTFRLYDTYGNIVQDGNVNWTVTRGTITTATNTTTISSGKAEFSCKIGQIAGTYTIIARFGAILLKSFSVRINHGTPTLSPQNPIKTCKIGENVILEVSLRDEFGNPCLGTVEWSLIDPLPTMASISATSTTIDSRTGLATVTITFAPDITLGIYMVKAAINGQEAAFTITIQAKSISDSDELLIYPNPIKVQEWDSVYKDGPWVRFGEFSSNVTIRIYDVSGNLIRIRENVAPDDKFVQWDMKNESGVEVNSGVYLCITTCNGGKRIGRFAVIR
ncbi:MAG: Ig-like domain-containing protein [bacterium]